MGSLIRRAESLAESLRVSIPGSEAEERERGRIASNPAILGLRVECGQRSCLGSRRTFWLDRLWYFFDNVWSTDEFGNITEDIRNAMVDCQARVVGSS